MTKPKKCDCDTNTQCWECISEQERQAVASAIQYQPPTVQKPLTIEEHYLQELTFMNDQMLMLERTMNEAIQLMKLCKERIEQIRRDELELQLAGVPECEGDE